MDLSAPSILLPQVSVPSTPSTLCSIYIVQIVCLSYELESEKNKRVRDWPFLKKNSDRRPVEDRGGVGQVAGVLAFYSDNPNSNVNCLKIKNINEKESFDRFKASRLRCRFYVIEQLIEVDRPTNAPGMRKTVNNVYLKCK